MGKHNRHIKQKQIISNQPDTILQYLRKTVQMSGLAVSFARNELQGKAAQTVLGHFISLLQILIATSVYWLIFGVFLRVDSGNIPFPLFVLTGMIPWNYFSRLVQESGNSLISSQHLLTKIYFPRVLLPIGKAFPGLLDFVIALITALIFMLVFNMPLRWQLVGIPISLIILIYSGLSIGMWISSISVRYRDLSRLLPQIINFGFFLTPVFYPSTAVPENFSFILYINPVAFVVESMRWAMFGTGIPDPMYLLSLVPVSILFVWGWHNYRKKEQYYADII